MGLWDQIRSFANRVLSGVDSIETQARPDPVATQAREMAKGGTVERELSGGLEPEEDLDLDLDPPSKPADAPPPAPPPAQAPPEPVLVREELTEPIPPEGDREDTDIRIEKPSGPTLADIPPALGAPRALQPVLARVDSDDEVEPTVVERRGSPKAAPPVSEDVTDFQFSFQAPKGKRPTQKFPNSLEFTDEEVARALEVEHYPELKGKVALDVLHALAVAETELLVQAERFGHTALDLLDRAVHADALWEAALYWSEVQSDAEFRRALAWVRASGGENSRRALAWALYPYALDIAAAAAGATIPCPLDSGARRLGAALERRRKLALSVPGAEAEAERRPVECRGLDEYEGFAWKTG